MTFRHRQRRRRSTRPLAAAALAVASVTIALMVIGPHTTSSSTLFAGAADVKWEGNKNVKPEHEAAHNAPRSQRYWDEHGIERPDYAKTDAEIAKERGESGGSGLITIVLVLVAISAGGAVAYAKITGDWETVLNNPVGAFVSDCINRFLEASGARGHKLGSSPSPASAGNGVSDEEARRLARLARFDNPRNMLDSMKSE